VITGEGLTWATVASFGIIGSFWKYFGSFRNRSLHLKQTVVDNNWLLQTKLWGKSKYKPNIKGNKQQL